MEFTLHAVAYLDILGFEEFVKNAESKPEDLVRLKRLFDDVIPREISVDGKLSKFPMDLEIKCLSVSDSIIVSAPVSSDSSYPALIAVSIKVIQIAHALLDMKLLVRGGIAVGNVYRTSSNIFGTGYQNAVQMEQNAHYPQIVLAESAKEALDALRENGYPRYAIFAKNELGQIILDSIYPEQTYLPDEEGELGDYFWKYRGIIEENLKDLVDLRAKEKWIWTARLFNQNIKYFASQFGRDIPALLVDEALMAVTLNYLNPPDHGSDSDWMSPFKSPCVSIQFDTQYIKGQK